MTLLAVQWNWAGWNKENYRGMGREKNPLPRSLAEVSHQLRVKSFKAIKICCEGPEIISAPTCIVNNKIAISPECKWPWQGLFLLLDTVWESQTWLSPLLRVTILCLPASLWSRLLSQQLSPCQGPLRNHPGISMISWMSLKSPLKIIMSYTWLLKRQWVIPLKEALSCQPDVWQIFKWLLGTMYG